MDRRGSGPDPPAYADAVELISPIYLDFTGGESDQVSGRTALARYFGTALARHPDLRLTLIEARSTRSLCLRYRSSVGDRIVMECFERDASGKALRVTCHYVD